MMNALQTAAAIALLAYAASCSAQIYECTDASGKKTYSKDCPENTMKEKALENPSLVSPGAPNASMSDKTRAANAAFEQRRAARLKAEQDEQDKASRNKESAQACLDAKTRLDALQSGKQAKRVDPVTGDHVATDETQRQAEIDGLSAQVAQNCK
jgi:hypothetical protein